MLPRFGYLPMLVIFAGCFAALTLPSSGQAPATESPAPAAQPEDVPVLKVNARTVVVDVVVKDRDGKPVRGLKQDLFDLAEDGHTQKLASFEEHSATQSAPIGLPALPLDVFTNIPQVKLNDAVTVLLLDSMNTALSDQQTVRREMLKYLKNPVKGRRMAIFTLGATLRMVQGFTDDPSVLSAVVKNVKVGSGPQQSDLLPTTGSSDLQSTAVSQIYNSGTSNGFADPVAQASGAALAQFFGEQNTAQNDLRVQLTLDAFQQLALYLAGIPGRKNVVWFSSAFPLGILPNPGNSGFSGERDYNDKVKKVDALLTAARVAVYPIAPEGVTVGVDVSDRAPQNVVVGQSGLAQAPPPSTNSAVPTNQNGSHLAMDEIAQQTGGHAYYNDNGLSEALTEVADTGSSFYTLSYIPSNEASDGQFRKIQVKLAEKGYKLDYRRGYYAAEAKSEKAEATKSPADPLAHLMGAGMPDITEISLAMRVQPATATVTGSASPTMDAKAGDNDKLKGPLSRYTADFLLTSAGLLFQADPDGTRHGKVRAELVAYDRGGRALNWSAREVPMDMNPSRYAAVQKSGIHFRVELDVPKDAYSLRGGVYDHESQRSGTLEVLLAKVAAPPPAGSPETK